MQYIPTAYLQPRILIDPETECWIWQLSCNESGYGEIGPNTKLSILTRQRQIHRASFTLYKRPLHSYEVIRHTCVNPKCCNPDHLEAGTHIQNHWDKVTPYEQLTNSALTNTKRKAVLCMKALTKIIQELQYEEAERGIIEV